MKLQSYSTDGPECPYCGREFTPDEGHYFSEDYTGEDCDVCGKTFDVRVSISTSWTCTTRDSPEALDLDLSILPRAAKE